MPLRTLLCATGSVRDALVDVLRHVPHLELLKVVESGGEALAHHRRVEADVAIVDGGLDGCDGARVAGVLARERQIPFVLVCDPGHEDAARSEARDRGVEHVQTVSRRTVAEGDRGTASLRLRSLLLAHASPSRTSVGVPNRPEILRLAEAGFDTVALIGSAGTPHMLPRLLAAPTRRAVPLVVAVHHNPRWSQAFAQWVGELAGAPAKPFAPASAAWRAGGAELQVVLADPHGGVLRPDLEEVITRMVALERRILVCLTSGMGAGPIDALIAARETGGRVVVLQPDACPQPAMVEAALSAGVTDAVVSVEECAWLVANVSASSPRLAAAC